MKPKALFICGEYPYQKAYGEDEKETIGSLTELVAERQEPTVITENPDLLSDVEVLFTGWSAPAIDDNFLKKAPKLKAVFHAAGSVKGIVQTDQFWERDIQITSAYQANSIPVAEFCLAQILLAVKRFWFFTNITKVDKQYPMQKDYVVPGAYKTKVGIVTLGSISKILIEYLKPFDMEVLVHTRSIAPEYAKELGVTVCSLDEIFEQSDVVSLHTPHMPDTENMIRAKHLRKMKENATFINTARGAIVHQNEMIEVAKEREDLTFLLDVIHPEPPEDNCPLFDVRNIVVSPHIAGSLDRECERMGNLMLQEFKHYLAGEPLTYGIDQRRFNSMA